MSERREAARSGALTRKQTALIHVARKQLRLSDERYRFILRKMAGVESAKDLDRTGFEYVMKAMMALASAPTSPEPSTRTGTAWRRRPR